MYFGLSDLLWGGGHDEAVYPRENGAEYRLFIDQFCVVQNMFSVLASKAFDLQLRHHLSSARTTIGCFEIK